MVNCMIAVDVVITLVDTVVVVVATASLVISLTTQGSTQPAR